jgi:uroporphyrinogen-III synthase
MSFTHVFISRPRQESDELADLLSPLGLRAIVQPAFDFHPLDFQVLQKAAFDKMQQSGPDTLVIFTSPRAVLFGVPQLPDAIRFRSRVAAIGPATSTALGAVGIRVNVMPANGYTSEALLETLAGERVAEADRRRTAFIVSARGGRQTLHDTLKKQGWHVEQVMVYRSEPAAIDKAQLACLADASGVLSVWTSSNAMKSLSQRLQPASWYQISKGEWLVISDRLERLARAYGPAKIHRASGPGNRELLSAIRSLR